MVRIQLSAHIIYHVYNRGVLKRTLFRLNPDYKFFINKIHSLKTKYSIEVLSYCLMPNHFHMLVYARNNGLDVARFMKSLQLSYALYFNKKYDSAGHVFEGTYRRKVIREPIYLSNIIAYIKNNPVRKGLVKSAEQWSYST